MKGLRPLLFACLVVTGANVFFALAYVGANAVLGLRSSQGRVESLCQWDCIWYRSVAEKGYNTAPYETDGGGLRANYNFWPGFPVGAALLMRATGLPFIAAGVALNAFYSLLFSWIALCYHREIGLTDERSARVFLVGFLISPWSIYNHVPYSEMLFNLTLLGTFVFWVRKKYVAAAAFGVVLTATRLTGIILPIVLLVELVIRKRRQVFRLFREPDGSVRALAIMPIGFVAFCVFLFLHVGDPLAQFHIQEIGWGAAMRNPLAHLVAGFGGVPAIQHASLSYIALTITLLIGVLLRRIPAALAAFDWVAPSIGLQSIPTSLARYGLALFPPYLLLPAMPRWTHLPLILMLAAGQVVFIYYWVQGATFLI